MIGDGAHFTGRKWDLPEGKMERKETGLVGDEEERRAWLVSGGKRSASK